VFEIIDDLNLQQSCPVWIHPQARRAASLVVVQECLHRMQPLLFADFINISARYALIRPHYV
jgi:hypothetical protein